ncbi:MAG: hypothetical protein QGG15_04760 [Dehalococcoidales bacterium]|jgi:hypothetical protein|nr:hypothetical protein [Dehalococcoidales bacterium]MDP6738312.1 hypothetical protein [Dehalococcoidales bacterium]|tara:strand:- start:169 stop:372 length:204 start_codon:yes stop_codon:yes gene_type:complete
MVFSGIGIGVCYLGVALLGGRQTNVHQASVTHYLALVGKAKTKIHVFKTNGLATPSASGLTEMFGLG